MMAPGIADLPTAMRVAHHLLLSHGMAIPVIRSNCPKALVGPGININWTFPASDSPADQRAERINNGMWVRWYMDPLYGRGYPQDMVAHFEMQDAFPEGFEALVSPDDLETIATPTDFIGLNYYNRTLSRDTSLPEEQRPAQTVFQAPRDDRNWTEMGWEVYPHGLFRVLANIYYEYKMPAIYITENGASYYDPPDENGHINDERRLRYLREHLQAAHLAIGNGVPLRGYFVWSLMDNFEWSLGYTQHFGIVACDIETGRRTMRHSAYWYRDVIAENGLD
jgi:beta-glucosidase